jgi:hypothetical protein
MVEEGLDKTEAQSVPEPITPEPMIIELVSDPPHEVIEGDPPKQAAA